ncbi:hypothetical protein AVEN_136026-1 [Araneus ventricosus]|uniref:Uncharacterized protein n=1 Tax=Araneus ventricosus TaxID=182803 RepID=A0A4Y2EVA9_ARAVE|nr:hypothetical protein AVEN_136026-1 [Araneus ventricosus]
MKQQEGYFGTDLTILNRGQMTRATTELAPLLQSSGSHQREGVWPSTYDLRYSKPAYTNYLQWNRVSDMEPSDPKAEILPLGHRGFHCVVVIQ